MDAPSWTEALDTLHAACQQAADTLGGAAEQGPDFVRLGERVASLPFKSHAEFVALLAEVRGAEARFGAGVVLLALALMNRRQRQVV